MMNDAITRMVMTGRRMQSADSMAFFLGRD
jgi:hypothetical protein